MIRNNLQTYSAVSLLHIKALSPTTVTVLKSELMYKFMAGDEFSSTWRLIVLKPHFLASASQAAINFLARPLFLNVGETNKLHKYGASFSPYVLLLSMYVMGFKASKEPDDVCNDKSTKPTRLLFETDLTPITLCLIASGKRSFGRNILNTAVSSFMISTIVSDLVRNCALASRITQYMSVKRTFDIAKLSAMFASRCRVIRVSLHDRDSLTNATSDS